MSRPYRRPGCTSQICRRRKVIVAKLISASILALCQAGAVGARDLSSGPGFSISVMAPAETPPAVPTAVAATIPADVVPVPMQASPVMTDPTDPAGQIAATLTASNPATLELAATRATVTEENPLTPPEGRLTFDRPGWFWVGHGDLTYGREFGGDDYSLGRMAGYVKGMTRSGYLVTGAIDTREDELSEIFGKLDEKNPDRVLRRIEAEDVYPTFGDDSTSYEDAPTSGKIYLRIEKDGNHVMWGDFRANQDDPNLLVRSDRTLYGAQGLWQSQATTQTGAPRQMVSAYASQPDRLMQRDVLRGTGGSVYFLKRQDILTGTEVVVVQWRDTVSGRIIRSERLTAGGDYDINYFQGIIDLRRPLDGQADGGGLIADGTSGDTVVDLVVQYEYVPTTGDVDGLALGLRAQTMIGDRLRLGVSGQSETTGTADNRLVGLDVLWRMSEATWLSADLAQSRGPGFGADTSLDGGLEFEDDTQSAGRVGQPAMAVRLEGGADLAELTGGRASGVVNAWYSRKEAGFVSADDDIDRTETDWGFEGEMALSAATVLTFGQEDFRERGGRRRADTRLGITRQLSPSWVFETEIAHTNRHDPDVDDAAQGWRTDLGARVTYAPAAGYTFWAFGQATARHSGGLPRNDRLGIGAAVELFDRLTAEAEISDGNLGFGADTGLRWRGNLGSSWISYQMDPMRRFDRSDFGGNDDGIWVMGSERRLARDLTLRSEQTLDWFGDRPARSLTNGLRYAANGWTAEGTMTTGRLDDAENGEIRRRSFSLGAGFDDGDKLKTGLRIEARRDDGDEDSRDRSSWGLSGYLHYNVTEAWRLVSDLEAVVSNSDQSATRDGRYIEANLGLAYRPVENDRWNMLARYTYLEDLPGPEQVNIDGDIGGPRQKSHIFGIDANYRLTDRWTLGGKLGYRRAQVDGGREGDGSQPSTATLAILRADYHVMFNWDLMAEGRMMHFHEIDVIERGLLLAAWRHVSKQVKLGAGYQFGDVSDDLRSIKGRKEGVFMNVVASF